MRKKEAPLLTKSEAKSLVNTFDLKMSINGYQYWAKLDFKFIRKILNNTAFQNSNKPQFKQYHVQISRNHKRAVRHNKRILVKENFVQFFLILWVQGQMTQRINVALNSIPSGCRDLAEFAFFCGVGFTFGSLGLI